jgi:hypothetical protein
MNILNRYVYPRLEEVVALIGEDPFRTDFGGSDIPTLICLVFLFIIFDEGDREAVIDHILRVSLYKESQILFVLDQYRGRNIYYHLWRRDARGKYYLNLSKAG